jgi:O-antigen/teichoic acid export membrane protein
MLVAAPVVTRVGGSRDDLGMAFALSALSVVPFSVAWTIGSMYNAFGSFALFQLLQGMAAYWIFAIALGFGSIFFPPLPASVVALTWLLSAVLVASVAGLRWNSLAGGRSKCRSQMIVSARASGKVAATGILTQAGVWIAQAVVMWRSGADAVPAFVAAFRISQVLSIALVAVNAQRMPSFARLHLENRYAELRRTALRATTLLRVLVIPCGVVMLVVPEILLEVMGIGDSRAAANVLRILVLGQLVNVYTGPSGAILMMTGLESFALLSQGVGSVVLVFGLATFGAALGTEGAALALSLSLMVQMLLAARFVSLRRGIPLLSLRLSA